MRFEHYYNIKTDCENFECVFKVIDENELDIFKVMALPEMDHWIYEEYHGKVFFLFFFIFFNFYFF
jgi:hypothetical protein